ncbi:azurin [Pontibacter aydingkolensis]|uniref:Azurin n=1 Tax=Pontibacter aydingkolensis TaxID=1911536 RepID=A0ABS7CTQ6_9BACT|nr:plastocyanin/azurin family copper-binding protein [Pontibacter aydingkolensis]MBW7467244.1 azurin [Pontibacter aydingkolensis]
MKSVSIILYSVTALWLLGCNSATDSNGIEVPADIHDTTSARITEDKDTTLQHVEEIILKAIGNSPEDMIFDQDTLEVKVNTFVKLTFINEGADQSMIHNVVFTQPDKYKLVALAGAKVGAPGNYVPESEAVIAASPLALPGQTVEMEFTAPSEPGTYGFVCTYPGHWQKMNGTLIVK